MTSTPTRNANAELRPSLVEVSCAEARSGATGPAGARRPTGAVVAGHRRPRVDAASTCGRRQQPAADLLLHLGVVVELLAQPVDDERGDDDADDAGREGDRRGSGSARGCTGATSVRVSIAAIAAETGEAARATPDCTTLTVIGRDGRIPLRYDTS